MANQNNQQIINQTRNFFEEVLNKGNLSKCDEIIDSKCKLIDPSKKQNTNGLQAFKETEMMYKKAFPDKKTSIDEIFASDDKVAVSWTCEATHSGQYEDIAPTNKKFKTCGISLIHFSNGKVIEIRQCWDKLGFLEQIGEIHSAHSHAMHK